MAEDADGHEADLALEEPAHFWAGPVGCWPWGVGVSWDRHGTLEGAVLAPDYPQQL